MSRSSYLFLAYDESRTVPNIVVDGSPNDATVLTLTHWPGFDQPIGTNVDTSAEMAFAYLDAPQEHAPARFVTNNHFDQDGTVGLFALIDPAEALRHRDLLVDLARAGDFGTYRYRDAARASMILHAFADPVRSPIAHALTGDDAIDTAVIYQAALAQLVSIITNPAQYKTLWEAEDEALSHSEEAVADGRIRITEHRELDLAVVEVDDAEPVRTGHRFGFMQLGPVHPMAIHNATDCARLLIAHRKRYTYVDRYETWVQFHTRRSLPRVDLQPLSGALTGLESGASGWQASAPSGLTPMLQHEADSTLDLATVLSSLSRHLETAPVAWDPYDSA